MTQIYIKQSIHTHQTQNFQRISPFGITPVEKAHKARTHWYRFLGPNWTRHVLMMLKCSHLRGVRFKYAGKKKEQGNRGGGWGEGLYSGWLSIRSRSSVSQDQTIRKAPVAPWCIGAIFFFFFFKVYIIYFPLSRKYFTFNQFLLHISTNSSRISPTSCPVVKALNSLFRFANNDNLVGSRFASALAS